MPKVLPRRLQQSHDYWYEAPVQVQKLPTFVKAEPAKSQKHPKARSLSQSDYKTSEGNGMFVVRKLVAPARADKMLTKSLSS